MARVAIAVRQIARLLRTLHDTFAEVCPVPGESAAIQQYHACQP